MRSFQQLLRDNEVRTIRPRSLMPSELRSSCGVWVCNAEIRGCNLQLEVIWEGTPRLMWLSERSLRDITKQAKREGLHRLTDLVGLRVYSVEGRLPYQVNIEVDWCKDVHPKCELSH